MKKLRILCQIFNKLNKQLNKNISINLVVNKCIRLFQIIIINKELMLNLMLLEFNYNKKNNLNSKIKNKWCGLKRSNIQKNANHDYY